MHSESLGQKGKAIIFSAPSGAGKTTIVHRLLQELDELEFSISATSREARNVERDGKDYYYLSVEEFKKKIANNEFVEWEEVYQNQFYGTLQAEVERIWSNGKHVIFDVDVVGGLNLKKHFTEKALSVFVKPPSIDSLKLRLQNRKTETEESIKKRLDKSAREMAYASSFDYILINDKLEVACNEAIGVVKEFLSEG